MKQISIIMIMVLTGVLMTACMSKAAPEDCQKSCDNLITLTKAAQQPAEGDDPVVAVETAFAKQIGEVQNAQAAALKVLDDELAGKLEAAKTDADKTKLNDEYAKLKTDKGAEFTPQLDTLNNQKTEALAAAQKAKAEKAEAQAKAEQEAREACMTTCAAGAKTLSVCQGNAQSLDEYNACK